MNKEIPPFYVGQEVEAIKDHTKFFFTKGQRFFVKNVCIGHCDWVIDVGIVYPDGLYTGVICYKCGKDYPLLPKPHFRHTSFRAITPRFEKMTYSKVIEEVEVGVN